MEIIQCPHCKIDLFIDRARPAKCGNCGRPLTIKRQGFLERLRSFLFGRASKPALGRSVLGLSEPANSDIRQKIDRLAAAAWGTAEDVRGALVLSAEKLRGFRDDEIVGIMLKHIRFVAPRLNVPLMTPHVVIEAMALAAGMFVEQDGWVKIAVDSKFFEDRAAACAILAHEVCHYVLLASGIREPNTTENERLTDAAMFVVGLGEIFLAGYHRKAGANYRPGHRLGYLTDAEYEYARDYVIELRRSPGAFKTRETELEERFKTAVRDAAARQRLVEIERKRHPGKSNADLIELALETLARDNR